MTHDLLPQRDLGMVILKLRTTSSPSVQFRFSSPRRLTLQCKAPVSTHCGVDLSTKGVLLLDGTVRLSRPRTVSGANHIAPTRLADGKASLDPLRSDHGMCCR